MKKLHDWMNEKRRRQCLNKVICPKKMIYSNLNQNGAYDKVRSGKKMSIEKRKNG